MFFAESIIDHISRELNIDSNAVRANNFFVNGQITHYNQLISNFTVKNCWDEVLERSNYILNSNKIIEFNRYTFSYNLYMYYSYYNYYVYYRVCSLIRKSVKTIVNLGKRETISHILH